MAKIDTKNLVLHGVGEAFLLSGDGKVDFASVNRELVQVQRSLEQGMADWETAASELEEIRLENERIHQELN